MRLTEKRKIKFAMELGKYCSKIGLCAVGSGAELKTPWSLIPAKFITRTKFDPTGEHRICLSNCKKKTDFHIAKIQDLSSVHEVNADFVNRFAMESMVSVGKINVECM